jgi:uncharacterized protein (TIGR00725 family)
VTAYVSVCGSGSASEEERARALEVGRLLAEAGAILVCGGLGGVMDAAAQGASAAGGVAIGILPGEDRLGAGGHLTVAVSTGMGEARNAIIARAADAVIAIGGEWGTLSEMALAMKMGKRVVGLDTWEPVRDGRPAEGVLRARTPEEAVRLALG